MFHRLFLIFIFIIFFTTSLLATEQPQFRIFSGEEIFAHWKLANSFFAKKEYYRSITELYRLKFYYQQESVNVNNLLAKNYYLIKDYDKLFALADKQIVGGDKEILELGALAYLQLGNVKNAETYWELSGQNQDFFFLDNQDLFNPQIAFWLSSFPGLGFVYTKDYNLALASFLLNFTFIYGIISALDKQEYTSAYLLFFFQYQFYLGGMRAAKEKALEKNQETIKKERKLFIDLFRKNW